MGLVLSLVGLIRGRERSAALWGLILTGLLVLALFGLPALVSCLL